MGAPQRAITVLAALAALPLVGCANVAEHACPAGLQSATRTELLFGLSRPDGSIVGPAAWDDFSSRVIAHEFPAGYTMLDAAGAWRDADKSRTIHEPSKVVLIVTPGRGAPSDHIAAVKKAYRTAFQQQSVGVVVSPTCAAF